MDWTALFNFLMIAGAVQGFIFNVATFLTRRRLEKPVVFLNLFVLFISLNNLQSWCVDKGLLSFNYYVEHFVFPWYVLIVPFFYTFLVYYLQIEKRKLPFIRLTLTIFFLEVGCRIAMLYLISRGLMDREDINMYDYLEDLVTLAYSLALFVKCIRIIYKYDSLYRPILTFDNLNWVKTFMKLGGVVIALWLVAILLNIFSENIKPPYSYYPLRIGSSLLIYWVGYQAFFQYVLLKDRLSLREFVRVGQGGSGPQIQPAQSGQSIAKHSRDFEKFDAFIREEKKYLDPYLSLDTVAEEVNMGSSTLSRLVNQHSDKNFSDYINSYRVEEACRLLSMKEFAPYTIVSIGLECGFNSKSTFYNAFRKFAGMTPTQYRRNMAPILQ